MDVRTSFEQFCDIHNSLSKKYGDPYITHIEDDQKYEEILKNYLVHAINDRFTINGPCICEWKDINLTIELSSAIHYYEYNHTLDVIPVINFYEHNKFNENSLRYKFGIEKETMLMRLFIIRVKFVVGRLKDYLCSAHNETVNNYGKPIGRNGVAPCSRGAAERAAAHAVQYFDVRFQ